MHMYTCRYLLAFSFSMSLSFSVSTQSPGQLYPWRPLESDIKKVAGSPETMATTRERPRQLVSALDLDQVVLPGKTLFVLSCSVSHHTVGESCAQALLISVFHSMKQLRIFLFPSGWDASQWQVYLQH